MSFNTDDLNACEGRALIGKLELSLLNLREYWPHGWPGLLLVYQRCMQQLGHSARHSLPPRLQAIDACAHEVAEWLERDGSSRQQLGKEPHYHNRLHMADTLVCLTVLLQAQRCAQGLKQRVPAHHEWLAMLAMLAHDLLHDGTINRFPAELESRSVQALEPLMQRHGLHAQDQQIVKHLILKTDPVCVRQAHEQIADRVFSVDDQDCLAVLVEEADILASTLSVTGLELTRQLSQEWESSNPAMSPVLLTPEGRLRFLQFGALFSSPASRWLEIPRFRQAEIDSLRPLISPT